MLAVWRWFTRHLSALDSLTWPVGFDPAVTRHRLDAAHLRGALLSARWSAARRWLGAISQVVGAGATWLALGAVGLTVGLSTMESVAAATVGSAIAIAVLRWVFLRFTDASTWYGVVARGAPVGFAFLGLGYGLLRLRPAGSWVVLVAATLIACGGVAAIYFSAMLVAALWSRRLDRHWRSHAREDALDELLYIHHALADRGDRNDLAERKDWIGRLERAAFIVEKRLSAQFQPMDDATRTWAAHRAGGAAAAIRRLKRLALAPSGDSWDALSAALHTEIVALGTGHLGDLRWTNPAQPARDPRWRLKRAVTILRTVAVAAIPFAVVLAVTPVFDLGPDVLRWARLATLGWAVVYLLLALDPTLKNKIETARATADFFRTAPDRKEQPPVRSEA